MSHRIIGIRHRVKATAEGEARPTQVSILYPDGTVTELALETETDELDFLLGQFPVRRRNVVAEDDLSSFRAHQIIWKKLKKDEVAPEDVPETHVKHEGKQVSVASKVPMEFEGLAAHDRVAMVLGGSGDSFAYALSRKGEELGAKLFRIPAFRLKTERGESEKDDDAGLLATTLRDKEHLFYEVLARDRALIEVSECYRARMDVMKARIQCGNRLRASLIGKTYRNRDGLYPEGTIQDLFDTAKANNLIFRNLETEEAGAERDLTKALESLDVYTKIFDGVEGCGMSVSAGIIACVIDIRRFATKAKFKAFLGAHVLADGTFPRRRRGQTSNWNPAGRQSLYLFGEQMNRRPDSEWGKKLRAYKVKLREAHPEVVEVNGKKRYTDGHIHKMALQRTMTKFAEWLYKQWWKLETGEEVREAKVA